MENRIKVEFFFLFHKKAENEKASFFDRVIRRVKNIEDKEMGERGILIKIFEFKKYMRSIYEEDKKGKFQM